MESYVDPTPYTYPSYCRCIVTLESPETGVNILAILKEVSLVIVGILIVFGISILLKYLTNSPIDWPDTVFKSG
ncbi:MULTISPECIES: hypothetical protein [Oceanobacillus]|uniref:Uncharacterized protein n=1 Tax=Oceanobacillus kimchii TaxID=746691 RepID=A0ABQ5TSX9_9BACI|nr:MULTISPECIES: hypothetical protein [Oceanobacillus]GLO68172.1 hypothetical protein MACH08_39560 [Oceanobacillus kimchii]